MDLLAGFSLGVGSTPADAELDRALFTMLETEGQRYASFFATLEQTAPQRVARATALAFFLKSSLGEAEVEALYASVKRVGVLADAAVMNETEFVLVMHLIVCRTKRGLAAVPEPFPAYLFPTLALPSTTNNNRTSSMPSPDKPTTNGSSLSSFSGGGVSGVTPLVSAPAATEIATLSDSTSLVELTQKEMHNHHVLTTQLAQIHQSGTTTLQHLQATLDALAAAVDQLGFPVPHTTHASIGALDDLGNLLRANVQSLKQDIQSLEISARMRSVADEATSRTSSLSGVMDAPLSEPSAAIAQVAQLSSQLAMLQHEATQLRVKKETLARQLLDKKKAALPTVAVQTVVKSSAMSSLVPPPPLSSSSSTSSIGMAASSNTGHWGDVGGSPAAVAPLTPPQETVRSTEAVSTEGFDFAAFPATSETTDGAALSKPTDFGWGAFE